MIHCLTYSLTKNVTVIVRMFRLFFESPSGGAPGLPDKSRRASFTVHTFDCRAKVN